MKKVLHVNTTMNIGGIENFLLNVFTNINKEEFEFTILCYKNEEFDYEKRLIDLGCKFIKINDPKKVGKKQHYKEVLNVLKNNNFDVVHCHTYFDSAIVCYAAKKANVKIRIAHSHTTEGLNKVGIARKFKWKIAKIIINMTATHKLACSKEAGKALFGNTKYQVINNGIDLKKYSYNEVLRNEIRKKYSIKNDEILIGHVGRFETAKNHIFIIDVLEQIVLKNPKYKLMFVGNGSLFEKIKEIVSEKKLDKNVIFIGSVLNPEIYYNAFDCFVFPSIYEGLGISLIEAQANCLNCIASTNVPIESKITNNVEYLDLNKGIKYFVDKVVNIKKTRNLEDQKIINESDYNIKKVVKEIEKIYNK